MPTIQQLDAQFDDQGNVAGLRNANGAVTPFSGLSAQALASTVGYTWATRPAAAANAGLVIRITDVGTSANGSLWMSDGTNWRPYGGRVQIAGNYGTQAAPIATITGNATIQTAALPSTPKLPAGMLIPGALVWVDLRAYKVGATAAVSYFGPGVSANAAPGGALVAALMGASMPITAGAVGPGMTYAQVLTAALIQSPTYTGMGGSGAGFGEAALNPAVDNFVVVQVNNSLAAGDSLKLTSLNVWVEF